ncbi:hypothetical protein DAI22_02g326950 [Oryza sativa Japonica Group]|nr:hypothetical protein DAI22_02g326950 [Oryza sativa Japonica Group]
MPNHLRWGPRTLAYVITRSARHQHVPMFAQCTGWCSVMVRLGTWRNGAQRQRQLRTETDCMVGPPASLIRRAACCLINLGLQVADNLI